MAMSSREERGGKRGGRREERGEEGVRKEGGRGRKRKEARREGGGYLPHGEGAVCAPGEWGWGSWL